MRIVCWVLIVGEQLKGGESFNFNKKVTVKIVNKLHSSKIGYPELTVHCRDKLHNLPQVTLKYNEIFRFRFLPNVFAAVTLYYCHFVWPTGNYHFDIYVQERDYDCNDFLCYWEITEYGPCGTIYDGSNSTACFAWGKALPAKNFTLSS